MSIIHFTNVLYLACMAFLKSQMYLGIIISAQFDKCVYTCQKTSITKLEPPVKLYLVRSFCADEARAACWPRLLEQWGGKLRGGLWHDSSHSENAGADYTSQWLVLALVFLGTVNWSSVVTLDQWVAMEVLYIIFRGIYKKWSKLSFVYFAE